ncbi:SOS response-associated peptidase family protein [Pseudomonas sp. G34]|uniref:SOS response-associated peptidase family protein n=1 Tax=Pseudomonas sp. G34 TaxID=3059083 RepID=UPI00280799FA|nr:SOS response-associated peptidase family protein [Pseudomonas sp. G34]MDQ7987091.1 SOS response-associated peptidase family protein [Pseudomonas sp. G34]
MCGRFTQYRTVDEYAKALQLGLLDGDWANQPLERYNVAPQSRVTLFHQDELGIYALPVRWGYAPHWADGKRPPAINARIETAATSRFWGAIWKKGRVIIPADGWYEWKKDPDNPKIKQPYFIRLKGGAPAFFAGIADVPQDGEDGVGGFAIITAASDQGMVDIHDRRPVVLPPDVAREWLEPGLMPERAEDLARDHDTPVDAFEWYPVGKAVGNVKNQGAMLLDADSDPTI